MLLRNFIHGGGDCLLVQPQSLRLSCFLVVCCVERHLTVLWNKALERVRGTPNVDAEFEDLVEASKEAKSMENPFQNLLLKKNRPQFIIGALAIPVFQQLATTPSSSVPRLWDLALGLLYIHLSLQVWHFFYPQKQTSINFIAFNNKMTYKD